MSKCRRWLADWLRRLAAVVDAPVEDALWRRARLLVLEQATRWPERSGEAKRHQVYAALKKTFPEVRGRVLSRAIEEALP